MMLVHIGETDVAECVHNAWLRTMEDGVHTYDIYKEGVSSQKVGTKEFAEAVAQRVGQKPQTLKAAKYKSADEVAPAAKAEERKQTRAKKDLVGVDVFLDWIKGSADDLGDALSKLNGDGTRLEMMSNRGVKVWPGGHTETFCSDHWRCRFQASGDGKAPTSHAVIARLLQRFADAQIDFIKTEHLCTFDGEPGYSLGQGQ